MSNMTIDRLKAYKRKAKAQRDNWKARALAMEAERNEALRLLAEARAAQAETER